MRDGYYLSTYLNPAGLARLVNVRHRHDHNISLWRLTGRQVELVAHWEFERITGQKMHRTPFLTLGDEVRFIDLLLAQHGVQMADLVEVWGTPDLATGDRPRLASELPSIAFHSVSHLYSAILMDSEVFYDGTVVGLAVDRGPDRIIDRRHKDHWFAGCVVRQGELEIFPVESPGPLYCEARDRFRMREGSLMALATATKAVGSCDREAILAEFRFDGSDTVTQSQQVFDLAHRQVRSTLSADPEFTADESLISAVMKEVQAISIAVMQRNVAGILQRYDLDPATAHLALAGGYALNCPTNTHLMDTFGFKGFLSPPCVGDSGQSMGIGLAHFHQDSAEPISFRYPGPYLGSADSGLAALADFADYIVDVSDYDEQLAVDDLIEGTVVWLAGRSEVGPRALGNRSLLGDPTSVTAKDALNVIKQREWWRPVAPVVLEDQLAEWFIDAVPSPFMLRTFAIRPDRSDRIPAVAHLDQSARVQTVTREQNRALYDLISAFGDRTGVPMLCNTSLNDKGEPIIDTVAEAIHFCLRRQVRVAYLNGRRVVLDGFARYQADGPLPRRHEPFSVPVDRAAMVRATENPQRLTDLQLHLYLSDLELCDRHDVRTVDGAKAVQTILDDRIRNRPGLVAETERTMHRNAIHFAAFGSHPLVPHRPDDAAVGALDRAPV